MLKLIKGASVYAPEALGTQDVLIADSRILKIARDIPAADAYEVEVLDGKGKLLFPGFIDSHVHILGGGGEGSYHTRTPEIMLTDITLGGVTTVVGCLGTDGTTRNMASAGEGPGTGGGRNFCLYIYRLLSGSGPHAHGKYCG